MLGNKVISDNENQQLYIYLERLCCKDEAIEPYGKIILKCEKCGAHVKKRDNYCKKCGQRLKSSKTVEIGANISIE